MRRTTIATFLTVSLIYLSVLPVSADNPHFKRGPFVSTNGLTVTITGAITGLGNGDVRILVDFPNATATTTCTNQGGTQAPGQNPAVPVEVTGTALFSNIKNGNLSFSFATVAPEDPTAAEAGCPNSKTWTAAIDEITFGSGTIIVQQESVLGSGNFLEVLRQTLSL